MSVCDDEKYLEESYRAQARECALEAELNFRRYRNAYTNGNGEMGKCYYDLAKFYQKCMREANNIAADIIFKVNNRNQPLHTVDLHRLFVDEAIKKLKERIDYVKTRSVHQLCVIVGRGIHSKCGPKLKNAVANYAFKNNIHHALDNLNPGRINLYLENTSVIQPLEDKSENLRHSSMYIFNRPNQVKLSDYFPQTRLKNTIRKNRNGSRNSKHNSMKRKHIDERVSDHSNEVPSSEKKSKNKTKDSTYSQNLNSFVDLLETPKIQILMKRKCNTQRSSDRSNEVPSIVKKSKTKRKNLTQNANELMHSSPQGTNDYSNAVSSSGTMSQIQRKDSTHVLRSAKYFFNKFRSSVCRFVFGFGLIGLMFLALSGL